MHERIAAFVGVFMAVVGEVSGEHGGFESCVSEGALEETEVDASFE